MTHKLVSIAMIDLQDPNSHVIFTQIVTWRSVLLKNQLFFPPQPWFLSSFGNFLSGYITYSCKGSRENWLFFLLPTVDASPLSTSKVMRSTRRRKSITWGVSSLAAKPWIPFALAAGPCLRGLSGRRKVVVAWREDEGNSGFAEIHSGRRMDEALRWKRTWKPPEWTSGTSVTAKTDLKPMPLRPATEIGMSSFKLA